MVLSISDRFLFILRINFAHHLHTVNIIRFAAIIHVKCKTLQKPVILSNVIEITKSLFVCHYAAEYSRQQEAHPGKTTSFLFPLYDFTLLFSNISKKLYNIMLSLQTCWS